MDSRWWLEHFTARAGLSDRFTAPDILALVGDLSACEKLAQEAETDAEHLRGSLDTMNERQRQEWSRAENAEARCARLERYVRHDSGCNHYNSSEFDSSDCTCGLDAALAPSAEAGKDAG